MRQNRAGGSSSGEPKLFYTSAFLYDLNENYYFNIYGLYNFLCNVKHR